MTDWDYIYCIWKKKNENEVGDGGLRNLHLNEKKQSTAIFSCDIFLPLQQIKFIQLGH